ncbi:MAG: CvpA family protein [Clostridia bacterium]|nr:CvpA family protein [Clostridia bacterium]
MNLLLTTNLSATVDIVALIFVGVFALWGLIRGFTKTFFSAFGTMLSLLFAVLLCSTVANFLQEKFALVTTVSENVSVALSDAFGAELMNATLRDVSAGYLENAGLNGLLVELILSMQTELPLDTTLNMIICPTVSYYIVLIISVIALFIIFKIIFFLIGEIVKKLYKNRTIATFDKFFGFALGLLHGIISLELLIMAISVIPIPMLQDVYSAIQVSAFANFIEDINLFNLIINAVIKSDVFDFVKGLILKN